MGAGWTEINFFPTEFVRFLHLLSKVIRHPVKVHLEPIFYFLIVIKSSKMKTNLLRFSKGINAGLKSASLFLLLVIMSSSSFGQIGASLNFDATKVNYVITSGNLIGTGSYTKEAWIRISSMDYNKASNILSTEQNGNGLYIYHNVLCAGQNPTYPPEIVDAATLTTNQWYHVAVTYNSLDNKMTLYKDGVEVGNATVNPITDASQQLVIGGIYTGSNYGFTFDGDIDEVRVWDVARPSADINKYFGCTIDPASLGLVAYYNFNQGIANGNNTSITTLTDLTSHHNDGTLYNFTLNGTTSNFTGSSAPLSGTCAALPVSMISFNGAAVNGVIELNWSTGSEINNLGFEIQRSANGNNGWTKIGYLSTQGNSVTTQQYEFTDNNPLAGSNFYRLMQTDIDGKSTYSKVVAVNVNSAGMVRVYPTIARSSIQIVLDGQALVNVPFVIVNSQGKALQKGTIPGNRQLVDVSSLSAGTYFIQIPNFPTQKFIKE